MATIHYTNAACSNCLKHVEHKARLHCLHLAEEEIYAIFRHLAIPLNEQDVLVRTIKNENDCRDSLKGVLSKLVRLQNV